MNIDQSYFIQSEFALSVNRIPINKIFLRFFIILFLTSFLNAQELSFNTGVLNHSEKIPDSTNQIESSGNFISVNADTLTQTIKPNLLPKNMSLIEKGLWGENGFLRTVG